MTNLKYYNQSSIYLITKCEAVIEVNIIVQITHNNLQ